MRTKILAFILFLFIAKSNAQVYKYLEKIPAYSLSTGATCLIDSKDFGSFAKFYLPTNNGLAFYAEAIALFPTSSSYKEYRLEYGLEVVFFKIQGFSMHAVAGFNYGYWQRKDEFSAYFNSTGGSHYHKDNSHFFGGGIDYEFNKNISVYATWKAYPLIFVSYVETGIRFNIYDNSDKPKTRRKKKGIYDLNIR